MNPFFHDEETYVGYALDFVTQKSPEVSQLDVELLNESHQWLLFLVGVDVKISYVHT
jgi:hypothetical protein